MEFGIFPENGIFRDLEENPIRNVAKNPNSNCRHIPTFVTFYKIIVLEIPQAANMGTTIVRMGDGQQGRWRWTTIQNQTTMTCVIKRMKLHADAASVCILARSAAF
jgi:hypothetical protein